MRCQYYISYLERCYHLLFVEEELKVPRESPWALAQKETDLAGNVAVEEGGFLQGA